MSSTKPYVFELNTYNIEDAKSNCLKMISALEQSKVSVVKIANSVDSISENIDEKGYTVSSEDFKNSLNNFINELVITSQSKLDGVYSKDVIDLKVQRASTGNVWVHQVHDSKYGVNSYQVATSVKAQYTDADTVAVAATINTGIATITTANAHSIVADQIITLTGTSNTLLDNKNFLVKAVPSGTTITINLGTTTHAAITVAASADVDLFCYGTIGTSTGTVGAASATSKKVAVKSTSLNSFIGFYLPGFNVFIDDHQTMDIQILEKSSRLDVDTKDSPATVTITDFRVAPRRLNDDDDDEEYPADETELTTHLGKFINANADSNDTTYNDADSKNCNSQRELLVGKYDQAILVIKNFFLSPALNM